MSIPVVNLHAPSTVPCKKSFSLERQIRIGAGMLVLLSAGLSWFVNPAFIALTALFGAGLVFAGITNLCAMTILLKRLPWNRDNENTDSCSR